MKLYTKRGDDGTTGLLYGGRLAKDDLRVEAYGTSDEAVSALGLARAHADGALAGTILRLQRELFAVGAELATAPENWDKLTDGDTRVTEAMVSSLEGRIDDATAEVGEFTGFVLPGETAAGAALDLARSIVRRCERRVVAMNSQGMLRSDVVLRYLNRLADLLWVLGRVAEEGKSIPLRGDR